MTWLDAPSLSILAGITRQKAHRALFRGHASSSKSWRGVSLTVRTIHGRGGRSGLRYEVLVSSLPADLQERFNTLQRLEGSPAAPTDGSSAEREWWYTILAPALAHPKHSRERGTAICDILARPLTDWAGRPIRPSERTLQRQIAAYELHGLAGLARFHRKDKGKAKVLISTLWDRATPFDEAKCREIASDLRDYIRGLYKAGTSAKLIEALATDWLAKRTAQDDFRQVTDDLRRCCTVPRRFIEAEKHFRKVAVFKKDRKLHEDARPRISRTRAGLLPMDVVFGDVHRLDIVMHRPDGSTAHPRAIAWLDAATNRIRFDLVLPAKGEDVGNADLMRSFIAMTQDPAWGMPARLYIDNGKEYGFAEFLDDAFKLVAQGLMREVSYTATQEGKGGVTNARPYNAQAKPIEGIFGRLEQNFFRTIPGWTGGDRMKKKTSSVGRPTEPFPGDLDTLRAVLHGHLLAYTHLPQLGSLKGKSPAEAYKAALSAGWQRITADADELRTVFSTRETRDVRQGCISFAGRKWTSDALCSYLSKKVTICIPKYEDALRLPMFDEAGAYLGAAIPDRDYALMDKAGARESSRRDRLHKAAIRKLDRQAPDIDPTEEVMRFARSLEPMPAAPVAGHLTISPEAAQIARDMATDPTDRKRRKQLDDQRIDRERNESVSWLHKKIMSGGS